MEGLGSAFITFTIEGYESLLKEGKSKKEEEAFAKQRTKDKRHKLRLRIKIRTKATVALHMLSTARKGETKVLSKN
jgi:hypothetical protein